MTRLIYRGNETTLRWVLPPMHEWHKFWGALVREIAWTEVRGRHMNGRVYGEGVWGLSGKTGLDRGWTMTL